MEEHPELKDCDALKRRDKVIVGGPHFTDLTARKPVGYGRIRTQLLPYMFLMRRKRQNGNTQYVLYGSNRVWMDPSVYDRLSVNNT